MRLGRRRGVWLELEQPTAAANVPRWGHGKPPHPRLAALLTQHHARFEEVIAGTAAYGADLSRIAREPDEGGLEPTWANPFYSGIDAASLYSFLRSRRPATYLEVGSGNSTRFAARAKRDGGLETRIVSIDPEPRTGIDTLCDETVRARLEEADLGVFDTLVAGDVVLFDGSHRVFMNNDVTTFFLDVLPDLPGGVLVGVHDITLPEDYHLENASLYWTEQYLLAMALLAGGSGRVEPVLPCHYVCVEPELKARLDATWDGMGLAGLNGYGTTFWFEPSFG
jgi:hypothetical protein